MRDKITILTKRVIEKCAPHEASVFESLGASLIDKEISKHEGKLKRQSMDSGANWFGSEEILLGVISGICAQLLFDVTKLGGKAALEKLRKQRNKIQNSLDKYGENVSSADEIIEEIAKNLDDDLLK